MFLDRVGLESFSWRRSLLVFPFVLICGMAVVFCRALCLGLGSSGWVKIGFGFLPVFICFGVMLAAGVLTIRMMLGERKGGRVSFKRLFWGSFEPVMETLYLSIPLLFVYLALWMVLGVFFLLKEIPGLGHVVSTIFVFAPFLLIFSVILLAMLSGLILFFVTPIMARSHLRKKELVDAVWHRLRESGLMQIKLLAKALAPISCEVFLLMWAAHLTNGSFSYGEGSVVNAFEWFFMMIPFAAILTPGVMFFLSVSLDASEIERK